MRDVTAMPGAAQPKAKVRIEQTRRELESLAEVIDRWLTRRAATDALGLHKTQLEAVRSVLMGAVEELRANLGEADAARLTLAQVYDLCREYDRAVVWLRRLWEYLSEKFDQREEREKNSDAARLLKSADEVVWSCYHPVLAAAADRCDAVAHGPVPLTYIEPEYSPATVQLDKPLPVNLMLTAELEFLDQFLESLPIPILRLPPWCVGAPWWLVYVAHEVGHHVQHRLGLVGHFREGLGGAALGRGLTTADAKLWGDWGEEIFADLFSVLMMGQWAFRAMVEAELSEPPRMVRRKVNYPAPVIRLALLESFARVLGLDTDGAAHGLDLEGVANSDPATALDWKVIDKAVEFARGELPCGLGTLEKLCVFDARIYRPDSSIEMLSRLIPIGEALADEEGRRAVEAARNVVAGSLCAWSRLAEEADDVARETARAALARQTIETLLKSGPRETRGAATRGAATPDGEVPDGGRSLAAKLMSAARGGA